VLNKQKSKMPESKSLFFSIVHRESSVDETSFEFPDPSKIAFVDVPATALNVPLRTVVRIFLGTSPQMKSILARQLQFILGRLRCFQHSIENYNKGIQSMERNEDSFSFATYWRRRLLDQLSAFGFQVNNGKQLVIVPGLPELIAGIESVYRSDIEKDRQLIAEGMVTFDGLAELYLPTVAVEGRGTLGGSSKAVFMVVDAHYEEHKSLLGMEKSFHWTMEFVVSMGEHFMLVRFSEVLSRWMGIQTRQITDLAYVPVSQKDPQVMEALMERGKRYVNLCGGKARFLEYGAYSFFIHNTTSNGNSNKRSLSRSGFSLLSKPGRIMVDAARGASLNHHASQDNDEPTLAMSQLATRYWRWKSSNNSGGSGSSNAESLPSMWNASGGKIPNELYIFCWPAIVGFSFTAKAWGHVLVSGLNEIKFQDNAFDQLVLPEERKQLIRALVRFGGDSNTEEDIIAGKKGGCIFLLHGPPGVGKTLTAEAIAEVLHRPLYYVSMGELGVRPDEMEASLSDILELCAAWDALVLLDEADVFLEVRSTSDLVRNAMVCVMLRLLEYHPGILFLTTNRIKSFDPAMESRVTVALHYDHLDVGARRQIWKNMLSLAEESHGRISWDALSQHVLNGRQIKNAVRLAVALAREKQSPVTQEILETTLRVTALGRKEMKEDDSWNVATAN
jgi:hypothetical protein